VAHRAQQAQPAILQRSELPPQIATLMAMDLLKVPHHHFLRLDSQRLNHE